MVVEEGSGAGRPVHINQQPSMIHVSPCAIFPDAQRLTVGALDCLIEYVRCIFAVLFGSSGLYSSGVRKCQSSVRYQLKV
jgi:hypothetical protein